MAPRTRSENNIVESESDPPELASLVAALQDQTRLHQEQIRQMEERMQQQQFEQSRQHQEQLCAIQKRMDQLLEGLQLKPPSRHVSPLPTSPLTAQPAQDAVSGSSSVLQDTLGHPFSSSPVSCTNTLNKHPFSNSIPFASLKLPSFSGRPDESIDQWLKSISLAKERSNASDLEVECCLSQLFQDSALDWYNSLSKSELACISTWEDWKKFLCLVFRPAQYADRLRIQAEQRRLQPNETLLQYFTNKMLLLKQVLGEETNQAILTSYMLEGLPIEARVIIQPQLNDSMTSYEIRRVMIESEILVSTRQGQTASQPGQTPPTRSRERDICAPPRAKPNNFHRPPPYPCRHCAGNHWMRDCPTGSTTNRNQVPTRNIRQTGPPTARPSTTESPTTPPAYQENHLIDEAAAVMFAGEIRHPTQDAPRYTPLSAKASTQSLQNSSLEQFFTIYVDTCAVVPVIDQALLSKIQPGLTVDTTKTVLLKTIMGIRRSLGSAQVKVSFSNDEGQSVSILVPFVVMPDIDGLAIMDIRTLRRHAASIDLKNLLLQFDAPKAISIPLTDVGESIPHQTLSDDPPLIQAMDTNPNLSSEQRSQISDLVQGFRQSFSDGSLVGETSVLSMTIDTGTHAPTSALAFKTSPRERLLIESQIQELESHGIIEDSNSNWSAPVILVNKKDGGTRMCVDYRRLNALTKFDQYPIPLIDDLLNQFAGKKWFSVFDANKGFHQVPLTSLLDREKTAFRTHLGLKQFIRMPFGLKNGPAVFQRLMDRVLGNYNWKFALVYIDDLIVYSDTFEDHLAHCSLVLDRIKKAGLTLSLKKTRLFHQGISALGHRISNLGLGTSEGKIQAVAEWKAPTDVKQVQQFIGLATYYRRFIKDFATVAYPLTRLLAKNAKFQWNREQDDAFRSLKQSLTTSPILAHPDFTRPFRLLTDASGIGLGGILSQRNEDGHEVVVCYISRQLSKEERNYSATELECLAIVWALHKLHSYVDGMKMELVTDHSALQWLYDYKGTNKKILRWCLEIQHYRDNMQITHRAGKDHANVDALSRNPLPVVYAITTCTLDPCVHAAYVQGYALDPYFAPIVATLASASTGTATPPHPLALSSSSSPLSPHHLKNYTLENELLYFRARTSDYTRLCVPKSQRATLLQENHDTPISGHLGYDKTYQRIASRYYWPKMAISIRRHVLTCDGCQRNKASNQLPAGLLQPLPIPQGRWEEISMDFLTGLPTTEQGHDAILVVVDRLTKMIHLCPTRSRATAPETATLFMNNIFRLHGLPKTIVSDRDPKFTSSFWRSLFELLETRLHLSTAYHPQTDGQTERVNRTLCDMLRQYTGPNQATWDKYLASMEFAYNSSHHPSINSTPFLLNYGFEPRAPRDLISSDMNSRQHRPCNNPTSEDFVMSMHSRLQEARDAIHLAQLKQRKYHDPHYREQIFQVNDLVMVNTNRLPGSNFKRGITKLHPKFIGPFPVVERFSDNAYRLQLPPRLHIHSTFNVSALKPYRGNALNSERETDLDDDYELQELAMPDQQNLMDIDDLIDPINKVEQILDKRTCNGVTEYLVKRFGCPDYDQTWEPETQLTLYQPLIDQFNARLSLP